MQGFKFTKFIFKQFFSLDKIIFRLIVFPEKFHFVVDKWFEGISVKTHINQNDYIL